MSPLLKQLLENKNIEDIVLNERGISFFQNGRWEGPLEDPLCLEKNLFVLSRRIADRASIQLGLTQPSADSFVDFNNEFFRAHVAVSPLTLFGTEITLRRIAKTKEYNFQSFQIAEVDSAIFKSAMKNRCSILVAGATGAGKSSFISALMSEIPENERVIILEDSPELNLPNRLSTKLVARTNRFGFREGAEWDLSHLVFESLRMRPDRIIVGECRGPEAKAISQALMTGHKGVITSIHAGSCSEARERFEKLASTSLTHWDLLVHISLSATGKREIRYEKYS